MSSDETRLIAFYLPQFHPLEVNDRFHGPGFTEWTHVTKAKPLFRGHLQPRLPGELGFYDLRLPEVRRAQAALAQSYGIDAFCYWHYWSDGQRMMESPFNEMLEDDDITQRFCLGWANHSWLDVNRPGEVLFDQAYPGRRDYEEHFHSIEKALHDPRYVRVDGKPLVYLFRPLEVPDLNEFSELWRDLAERSGLGGLHLVGQDRGSVGTERLTLKSSLDAMVKVATASRTRRPFRWRVVDRLRGGPLRFSYQALVDQPIESLDWTDLSYPSVLTNWDNTPRWGKTGTVVVDPTAEGFGAMISGAIEQVATRPVEQRIVFVKSWNEWAEGNYLEPDALDGRARLEALAKARGINIDHDRTRP